MKTVGNVLAFVVMAIVGLFAGAISGGIASLVAATLLGQAHYKTGLIVVEVVLDVAVAVGVFVALRGSIDARVKVLCAAAGVGALGGLTVCGGMMFYNH